jgi:hypothetical protein
VAAARFLLRRTAPLFFLDIAEGGRWWRVRCARGCDDFSLSLLFFWEVTKEEAERFDLRVAYL